MRRILLALVLLASAGFGQTRSRLADYAVILEDQPVARAFHSRASLFGAQARPHLERIRGAQRSVTAELARRNISVAGASQILVNAIFISTDHETAARLRGLPGVAGVTYLPPLKPALDAASTLVKAPEAWALVNGASNAGAGVKIGIIDSGIDQNHPAFQDSSLTPPAGFPKGNTDFTNSKVIVARSFLEQTPWPDPDSRNSVPDDISPADRVGHGTAIAMIAAGRANQGPLASIQGIAPKAFLGNYKVQGSPGVNFVPVAAVIQALEQAIQDGMDIVTVAYAEGDMPSTGPLQIDRELCQSDPNGICDPIAFAVENATRSLVVVTPAGNSGANGSKFPTLNTIHSPGTAPSALTVGASTNSHALFQSVIAVSPDPPASLKNIKALFGDGPQRQSKLTAPIKDVAQTGNNGRACAALPASSLTGAIAIVERGDCAFADKILNAQNAGALAVVIYQSAGNETPYSGLGVAESGIPAMMVGRTDGLALKAWAAANPSATATLDPAFTAFDSNPDVVAHFSSRGPAIGTLGIKPEIVAPGVDIYTATQKIDPNSPMFHASGYTAANGTSMAVGFAAGAAALVKQKYPQATPPQIKSLVVNTASDTVLTETNPKARVTDVGAGKLNAAAAVGGALAFEPATISFGSVGAASFPIGMSLSISNVSNTAQAINISIDQRDADTRAGVVPSLTGMTIQPNQTVPITIRLQGSRPNPGSYEGAIRVVAGSTTYRVPYIYFVSDGLVDQVFPIADGQVGAAGDTGWLILLKAIDRFGLPVTNIGVQWSVVSGGGSVTAADDRTFQNGDSGAIVAFGPSPGDKVFRATLSNGMTTDFRLYARPYQTINSGGVLDAATNRAFSEGFAPGSYISIYGDWLAPARQAVSTPDLPFSLSLVSVGFFAQNGRFAGRLHFVSPNQINVQVPWELEGQRSAKLVVRIGDVPSAAYDLPLAGYSPGVFSDGAAILDHPANRVVNEANPAVAGQVIQLFVNGLGSVDRRPGTGEITAYPPLVSTTASPTVTVGGRDVPVEWSGMTPGSVGLYQINVRLPSDLAAGRQSMVIRIGGVSSKATDLWVRMP